jgi:hypothetical protein
MEIAEVATSFMHILGDEKIPSVKRSSRKGAKAQSIQNVEIAGQFFNNVKRCERVVPKVAHSILFAPLRELLFTSRRRKRRAYPEKKSLELYSSLLDVMA